MQEAPAVAGRRAAFAFIFVTVSLDMLALGMIAPVLPGLVESFLGGNTSRAAEWLGVFGTVWAFMQFFFSPVLGSLSDRFGRRPVILLSNFGLGLDYLVMAIAPNLGWLFIGRTISGITSASVPTAMAYIADVTPVAERAGRFGMLSAAFGLGFVIGPAFGGLLGNINPRLPFWVAGGLSLLNAVYGLFVLPESLAIENRGTFSWRRANPLGSLVLLKRHPWLWGLATAMFFGYVAHQVLPSTYVIYTNYRYHWDDRTVGLSLAIVGICSAAVGALLVRPVVRRLGERLAMLVGIIGGIGGFSLFGLAVKGIVFTAGIPVLSVWGLGGPSIQTLMTHHVEPSEQGQLQGAIQSLQGTAGLIGPMLFTFTFARAISAKTYLPGAPFLLAGLLLFSSLVIAAIVTRGANQDNRR